MKHVSAGTDTTVCTTIYLLDGMLFGVQQAVMESADAIFPITEPNLTVYYGVGVGILCKAQ